MEPRHYTLLPNDTRATGRWSCPIPVPPAKVEAMSKIRIPPTKTLYTVQHGRVHTCSGHVHFWYVTCKGSGVAV